MHRHFKLVVVILFGVNTTSYADGLLFAKENIAVTILSPSSIQVDGEYFFTSADNKPAFSHLFYPFPIDSASLYPCSISVMNNKNHIPVLFSRNKTGISFSVEVNQNDTTCILVIYRQQVRNQQGTYILTTTNSWGKPLNNSNYSICIPQSLTLRYLSYECDSVSISGSNMVYKFFRKKFMPNRDLLFTWTSDSY